MFIVGIDRLCVNANMDMLIYGDTINSQSVVLQLILFSG